MPLIQLLKKSLLASIIFTNYKKIASRKLIVLNQAVNKNYINVSGYPKDVILAVQNAMRLI